MTAVTCQHLVKTFQQGDELIYGLNQVDFVVPEGDFVCLSGPSGSGKTTLLNAIGGLDTPTSGTIDIDGQCIDHLSKTAMADMRLNKIGFVFQAYNLIPVLSALENVEFVMQVQSVPTAQRRQAAMAILKEVGLEGMEHRRPAELSGGQQQRVAVARAIVSKPALVLADEPTANLDSISAQHLMSLFVALNQNHNITFIISTHDQRVMSYAKRLITMVDGKIETDEQLV